MDECTSIRTAVGLGIAKRGAALSFRDSNNEDRGIQCCNRIGCNTRLKSMKGPQVGNPENGKFSRPSFLSSSSKAVVVSSSKPFAGRGDLQKLHQEQQKPASLKETILTESSSRHGEEEVSVVNPLTKEAPNEHLETEDTESAVLQCFTKEVGTYSVTSSSGARKQVHQRSGLHNQDTSLCSSVRRAFLSRNKCQDEKFTSPGQSSDGHRYDLKNLSRTSVSDSVPLGYSSSDSGQGRRDDAMKKRCTNEESFSSGTKGGMSSTGGNSSSQRKNALSRPSLSFFEGSTSQQASSKTRNWSSGSNSGVSVRTRRTFSAETRTQEAEHVNDNCSSLTEPVTVQQLPQTEILVSESTPVSSSQSFPIEYRSNYQNSYGHLYSSSETVHRNRRPIYRPEDSNMGAFHGLSVNRDGFRHINMDGITEVLLALERIEQDEELRYEQLLALDTNLLLGGFSFNDQHRGMRLDIDNMSYEELLALEEKMGTVSTALTEEALSKCLKRSCYIPRALLPGLAGCGDDDIKCSICREDYVAGDVVGKLGCEHGYHVDCIHQWLRLKNWCPICKFSVSPS